MNYFDNKLYVLEIFSGNGTTAKVASHVLGCKYETIDIEGSNNPTITMDIRDWNDTNKNYFYDKYKNRRPVIFASPPCTEYSAMKTNGIRKLDEADDHVYMVEIIASELNAVIVYLENPETGLLKSREVIDFLPYTYTVHYCAYGSVLHKPTMIWTSKQLPAFKPKHCQGDDCAAVIQNTTSKKLKHAFGLGDLTLDERYSVPKQLIISLIRASKHIFDEDTKEVMTSPYPKRRRPENFEVDFIVNGYEDKDGMFYIEVQYTGYDGIAAIPVTDLDADLDEYNFAMDKTTLKELFEAYNLWKAKQPSTSSAPFTAKPKYLAARKLHFS